jgi:hypothetical protein
MLANLKKDWRSLLADAPGERFRNRYKRRAKERKSPMARIAWSAASLVLILAGIVALPLPGPGMVVIAAGLGLLASESLTVARACDRIELWLRALFASRRKPAPRR